MRENIHIELPQEGIVMGHVEPEERKAYLARLKVTGPRHFGSGSKLLGLFTACAEDKGATRIVTYLAPDPGESTAETEAFLRASGFQPVDKQVAVFEKNI